MTHKRLMFRAEAREKILRGATLLADAVRMTLGPKSHCVLLEKKWGVPEVCDDGVTIAKNVDLEDAEENLGAQMLRQAAQRTGDVVGDGTTTATILAHAIYAEGVRNIAAGASAVDLRRGLERGLRAAVAALKGLSRPVETHEQKMQVATVSAHNQPAIGEVVAEAIERVGGEGAITVEESKGMETSLEVVEGLQFDRGYLSPYFVTDSEKMEAVLEEPLILLHEKRIGTVKDLIPLLDQVVKQGRPLLMIAEDVDGEALATLVVNKLRGVLACAAAKAPGYGDRRREMLEDIAALAGARLVSEDLGMKLENVALEHLGSARRVVLTRENTTIIGGHGDAAAIEGRKEQVRARLEKATSDYDREKLEERLSKLSGGVAVIRVGAPTETELKNRREAFEDAISATKAAVAEGLVPGGGLALVRAIAAVESEQTGADGDERTGLRILARALEAPVRQLAANSDADGGVVLERMRSGRGNLGFDAARCEYVDLIEAGIIDPTKVVRMALENAVSVASTLLLTEATLTEVPEPKPAPAAAPDFG